jgi:hypothetical protein
MDARCVGLALVRGIIFLCSEMAVIQNIRRITARSTKLSLVVGLLCLACVCVVRPQSGGGDDEAIREAVARYQIAKWDLKAEIYFLSVDGKDPSDALLKSMADINPPVKKKSLSKKTKDAVGEIVEAKTEKVGVIFGQEAIHKSGEGNASVSGGYYCGKLCSTSGVYHLELRGGHWVVTGFEPGAQT